MQDQGTMWNIQSPLDLYTPEKELNVFIRVREIEKISHLAQIKKIENINFILRN